ncbi:bifunctional Longin domain/Chaperonin TCP-1, partial [Babesia duncani]
MGDLTLICRGSDGLPLVETWEDRITTESINGKNSDLPSSNGHVEHKSVKMHARLICRRLPQTPGKCTITEGDYSFHYILESGICYLTVTKNSYSKKTIFVYLAQLCEAFTQELLKDAGSAHANLGAIVSNVTRPYHYINFERTIRKIRDNYTDSNKHLESVSNDISQVTNIMRRNISELLNRGESLQAIDEFGKPIALLKEENQKRVVGLEAHKANILAARSIADTLRTSLGPRGMDKIITSPDGQVTVTNDGATILQKMEVEHQCAKLLVDLSKSQDEEVGDGTTGVVILAGALLDKALKFLDRGLHPLHITDGYERACSIAISHLESIAQTLDPFANDNELLKMAAYTSLASKIVSSCQDHLANIAVGAVLAVADSERKDPGGRLEETCLIDGVVLNKDLSHSQMAKTTRDAKIAILTCPFEPPKPKTKNRIEISTVEEFQKLQECEQAYFVDMVNRVVASGANFVICQWGFDDEANHLLMKHNIPAVRWVGGVEMELIAIATGGRIVGRFEDLTPDKLGHAGLVREVATGTEHSEMIFIQECSNSRAVT